MSGPPTSFVAPSLCFLFCRHGWGAFNLHYPPYVSRKQAKTTKRSRHSCPHTTRRRQRKKSTSRQLPREVIFLPPTCRPTYTYLPANLARIGVDATPRSFAKPAAGLGPRTNGPVAAVLTPLIHSSPRISHTACLTVHRGTQTARTAFKHTVCLTVRRGGQPGAGFCAEFCPVSRKIFHFFARAASFLRGPARTCADLRGRRVTTPSA